MGTLDVTFAYMTPEAILPMASAVVAACGFILLVGLAPFRIAARGFRYAARGVRSAARGVRALIEKLDL
jgi:hypothetical protein